MCASRICERSNDTLGCFFISNLPKILTNIHKERLMGQRKQIRKLKRCTGCVQTILISRKWPRILCLLIDNTQICEGRVVVLPTTCEQIHVLSMTRPFGSSVPQEPPWRTINTLPWCHRQLPLSLADSIMINAYRNTVSREEHRVHESTGQYNDCSSMYNDEKHHDLPNHTNTWHKDIQNLTCETRDDDHLCFFPIFSNSSESIIFSVHVHRLDMLMMRSLQYIVLTYWWCEAYGISWLWYRLSTTHAKLVQLKEHGHLADGRHVRHMLSHNVRGMFVINTSLWRSLRLRGEAA